MNVFNFSDILVVVKVSSLVRLRKGGEGVKTNTALLVLVPSWSSSHFLFFLRMRKSSALPLACILLLSCLVWASLYPFTSTEAVSWGTPVCRGAGSLKSGSRKTLPKPKRNVTETPSKH